VYQEIEYQMMTAKGQKGTACSMKKMKPRSSRLLSYADTKNPSFM
jgi:hypothetical protein